MNQRDRAFLLDMKDFICLNRLATVFALLRNAADPQLITRSTMKYLRFYDGVQANVPEPLLDEFVQNNLGNVQAVMIAKVYGELLSGYEDLGTFGSAIKYRASKGKGIFEKYVASETREAASFFQEILDSYAPNHAEVTLDVLLNLPPVTQLGSALPQDVLIQLESYYREIPTYLYQVAQHYRAQRKDAQVIKGDEIPLVEPQSGLAIILGFVPPIEEIRRDRLSVDVFNRIKHQFLVTGKLAAYRDPEDLRVLEYATLRLDQAFADGMVQGISSVARVMSDFASILLLLDSQGISL